MIINTWIEKIFKSKIAQRGGVVRRIKSSVEKHATIAELKKEVKRRGYYIVQYREHLIIFCSQSKVIRIRLN